MLVREVMTRRIEMVHPDTPLQEAAEKMRDLDVGPLPVCDGDRLVGMITDRDITIRSTAKGHNPWTDHVRDAMTTGVLYCFEDQAVEEASHLMEAKRVRWLVVLDRQKRLVGMVSQSDLTVATENETRVGKALQGISPPRRSDG